MTLADLLDDVRADLLVFVRSHAGWLRRFETDDDLLQGVQVRALERADQFEYRGREPFLAWIYRLTRSHLADRRAYWSALKRRPARLVRITRATPRDDTSAVQEPAGARTGPETFAQRLAISYDAAKQARSRALDRYRRAYALVP